MQETRPPDTGGGPAPSATIAPRKQATFLERWWKPLLYFLFLLASEIFFSEQLEPLLEGARKSGVLGFCVHLLFLGTLPFLCASVLRLPGRGLRKRVFLLLLVAGSYSAFFMAIGDPFEQVRVMLFFPLGILVRGAKSNRWGGARYWLDLLLLFATFFFVDSVLKGVLPNREFSLAGSNAFPFLLMPVTGLVYARLKRPQDQLPSLPRGPGRRDHEGKTPIVDLHLYPRDLLYVFSVCFLMTVTTFISGHLGKNSLIGRYNMDGDPGRTVVINGYGRVLCGSGDALRNVGGYYVSGNLLDGFLLQIYPDGSRAGEPCDFITDYVNQDLRFRTASGSVYFDQKTSAWKWTLWTILEKETKGEGEVQWQRVNRSAASSGG